MKRQHCNRREWLCAAVLAALWAGPSWAEPPADLILMHGKVRTEDPRMPLAEAVAVSHGVIVQVGSAASVQRFRGPDTEVIDLDGRTVLPGLSDAHVHPAQGEFLHHRLCEVGAFTVAEGFDKLRRCASSAPAGDWVVGYGWYDLDNPGFDALTRAQLDELVPDRKLAVVSRDIHTVWVNSRTLAEFGIGRTTPSPPGGQIVRDPATEEPTGMLIDAAAHGVVDRIQHGSPYSASTRDIIRDALRHLNSLGITSILDAFADDDTVRAYAELDRAGELTARVTLAVPVMPDNFRTEIPRIAALRKSLASPNVAIGFIKVIADGNGEVGLASFLNHDGHPGAKSPGYYTDAQMTELVELAERHGIAVFVHVIGDGATRQVLDAIDAARKRRPHTALRHTLTHLCWIDEQDMPRLKRLQVIANIQEGWLAPSAFGGPPGYDYARSTAAGPLGPWLGGRAMPYRAIRDAGATLAAGSDWFYTDENPWNDMEAGATAKDPGGPNRQAMLPYYTLDVASLLDARTKGAAYQMYREADSGSIATGRRADLVVVDQDPVTVPVEKLHETRVDITLLGGRVVYRR